MARPLSEKDQIQAYNDAKSQRNAKEHDWRLAAAYCLPQHYNAWSTDGPANFMGNSQAQLRRTVFDSTGVRSLPKYMAILERLSTPTGMKWHTAQPSLTKLLKSYRVRTYFDNLTDLLFKYRYNPKANFRTASNEVYASMGAYGTGPVYVSKRKISPINRTPGMIYKACPLRDIFMLVDEDGVVVTVFRRFWLNATQFRLWMPDPVPAPRSISLELQKPVPDVNKTFEFFHVVQPRKDYDPESFGPRRYPFVSSYMCVGDMQYVGDEEGFRSLPYLTPRTFTVAGDAYGHGPAVNALAAMGGASTMKKSHLKQGNLAAEPVVLAYDEGVLNGNVDLRPGHVNYGGVDRQGRKMVQTLDAGRWDVGKDLLQGEQHDVEDAFLVTLFQILVETPEMTATEVLERVAEKAALLSPTMGRVQGEFLGPDIEREIDVLDELGVLPEMPPELVEARGEYEIIYTSPMAKGVYAEEVKAFIQSVEFALGLVEATQNPEHLDHFDFNTAIPEIADKTAVPTRWMADPTILEQKRKARSQQAEQQQLLEAAPAIASVAKTTADIQQQGARR